jgi:hypothetical protein
VGIVKFLRIDGLLLSVFLPPSSGKKENGNRWKASSGQTYPLEQVSPKKITESPIPFNMVFPSFREWIELHPDAS